MGEVRSKPLANYLAGCVDTWRETNPELTCMDILSALELMRFKLTEAMLRANEQREHPNKP